MEQIHLQCRTGKWGLRFGGPGLFLNAQLIVCENPQIHRFHVSSDSILKKTAPHLRRRPSPVSSAPMPVSLLAAAAAAHKAAWD